MGKTGALARPSRRTDRPPESIGHLRRSVACTACPQSVIHLLCGLSLAAKHHSLMCGFCDVSFSELFHSFWRREIVDECSTCLTLVSLGKVRPSGASQKK